MIPLPELPLSLPHVPLHLFVLCLHDKSHWGAGSALPLRHTGSPLPWTRPSAGGRAAREEAGRSTGQASYSSLYTGCGEMCTLLIRRWKNQIL